MSEFGGDGDSSSGADPSGEHFLRLSLGDVVPPPAGLWTDEEELPHWIRTFAGDFDVEPLIDTVVARCAALAFPEHVQDEEFLSHLRQSTSTNAYALRDVIAGAISLDALDLDKVLSFASIQAELRVPQKSMQRSYRVSFFTMHDGWARGLEQALHGLDITRDDAVLGLIQLTRTIMGYQDHAASRVAETYTRDYEALSKSRAHVRRNLVREILRGDDDGLSASDLAILAYELPMHHVCVLLPRMPEGAANQLAIGLRAASNAQNSLVFPITLSSTAVWLGRIDPWHQQAKAGLESVLATAGVVASVGRAHKSLEGFRQSFNECGDAERIRDAWGAAEAPPVLRFEDVGLETLLLHDNRLARSFVEAELGALADDTNEARRLRETLEASFRFGSHVAAAEFLELHEHTVRNRLSKAESLLGHSLQERRTELQVAVRLIRLLGKTEAGEAERGTS